MPARADAIPARQEPPAASLRTRITGFVTISFALLVVGFGFASYRSAQLDAERVAQATLAGQQQLWQAVVQKDAEGLATTAKGLAGLPGLGDMIGQHDPTSLATTFAAAVTTALGGTGQQIAVELIDPQGQVLYQNRPTTQGQPLTDTGTMARAMAGKDAVMGVGRDDRGGITLRATVPVPGADGPVGAVTLSAPAGRVLGEIARSTGAEVFLVDDRNALIEGTDATLWQRIARHLGGRHQPLATIGLNDHTLAVASVPVLDRAGSRIGYEVTARDVTEAASRQTLTTAFSLTAVGLFLAVILLTLHRLLYRAFRPLDAALSALHALAEGDTAIDVPGESRRDEIGRIARAVRVFRDKTLNLSRQRTRQERQQRRQRRFIRNQMQSLAHMLDEEARTELLADLERIEAETAGGEATTTGDLGTLAVAFKVMTERVVTQHHRLDALVQELSEALKAKTELIGLQQQVAMANRMQSEMLPQALPPREDVEVRGALLAAVEFGGDFYDFFPLTGQRLAIIAGNVSGASLPGVFLTLTARTLLKTILQFDMTPGAAMATANDMLSVENRRQLDMALFIAIVDIAGHTIDYCTAGYGPPMLMRRLGDVAPLDVLENPLPGRQYHLSFQSRRADLPARSTVFVCSPGLTAGRNPDGEAFGMEGLTAALKSCDALDVEAVVNTVMSVASSHGGGTRRTRDASGVALRILA